MAFYDRVALGHRWDLDLDYKFYFKGALTTQSTLAL